MEIYFAEPNLNAFKKFNECTGLKPNVLFSYKYICDKKNTNEENSLMSIISKYKPITNKMMLDSGGFSTKDMDDNSLECITLENKFNDFIEYKSKYLDETFSGVFAFDKINQGYINFEKNFDRYDSQYSKYPKIIPIVHNITTNSTEIEEYSVYGPHTIAIGYSTDKTNIKYLKPATEKIRQICKSHLLGVTSVSILSIVETDTCDSTSWLKDSNSGVIRCFYEDNGKILSEAVYFPKYYDKTKSGACLFDDFKFKDELIDIAETKFSLKKEDFDDLLNGTLNRELMNIYYTMKYEKLLTDYYKRCNMDSNILSTAMYT